MRVTKRRIKERDCWQVVVDGQPVSLFIFKGPPPKYRASQTYDVCGDPEGDTWMFETRSVEAAVANIWCIMAAGRGAAR